MASYHMTYQSDLAALNEQETLKRLVMRRVAQAIQDNEHDIAITLGFSDKGKDEQDSFYRSHLGLSDIHSIEED